MTVFELARNLDNNRCCVKNCRCRINLEVHHIVPRSQGGTNNIDNLITLCSKHHKQVTNGKLSNLKLLKDLKYKANFRWHSALEWHIQKNKMRKLRGLNAQVN
jgi:5-methylcytosine-specific restriction endonuclease McrA